MENETENKNDKKQLEILHRELEKLKGEKNDRVQLKTIKLNTLLVLRQFRKQFEEKEYQNYEGKINIVSSREEIEVILKEFLLKINQKIISSKTSTRNKSKKDKLAEIEQKNKDLEAKNKLSNDEIEKLKGEIENLKKQEKEKNSKNSALFIIVAATLII